MANPDPRDVEATREIADDIRLERIPAEEYKHRGSAAYNEGIAVALLALLTRVREQERQACEQIVREEVGRYSCTCDEAYRSRRLTDPLCSFCNVVAEIRDEILRRIRERSQPEVTK